MVKCLLFVNSATSTLLPHGKKTSQQYIRLLLAINMSMCDKKLSSLLGPKSNGPCSKARERESRILRQWSSPVSGSRTSQASSPWAKQHRDSPVPSWRNHIQDWMTVGESYSPALEKGALRARRLRSFGNTPPRRAAQPL